MLNSSDPLLPISSYLNFSSVIEEGSGCETDCSSDLLLDLICDLTLIEAHDYALDSGLKIIFWI